jgi:hypothetical protein
MPLRKTTQEVREVLPLSGVYLLAFPQFNGKAAEAVENEVEGPDFEMVYYIGQAVDIFSRFYQHKKYSHPKKAPLCGRPRCILLRESKEADKAELLRHEARFIVAAQQIGLTLTNTATPSSVRQKHMDELVLEKKCLQAALTILQ